MNFLSKLFGLKVKNEAEKKSRQSEADARGYHAEDWPEKLDRAVVWNDKGCDFLEQKNSSEAIGCFLKAIEIMPAYPRAHCNLANCYDNLGQTEKAISAYNMALKCAQAFDSKEDLEHTYREYAIFWQRYGNKAKELECIAAANRINARPKDTSHNSAETLKRVRILLAEQGDAKSQWILACMYAEGQGVPRNVDESVKWARLAAANGHPTAMEAMEKLSRQK
jgi:tetratricopeptide (TPR) repeat protein